MLYIYVKISSEDSEKIFHLNPELDLLRGVVDCACLAVHLYSEYVVQVYASDVILRWVVKNVTHVVSMTEPVGACCTGASYWYTYSVTNSSFYTRTYCYCFVITVM